MMAMVKARKTLGMGWGTSAEAATVDLWAEECFSAANGQEALFIRNKQFGDHGNTTRVCIDTNLFLSSEKSDARQPVHMLCSGQN